MPVDPPLRRSDEVYEWRACAADAGDSIYEAGYWRQDRHHAHQDARDMIARAEPPYDRVWLQRRTICAPLDDGEVTNAG